jgi:hypothetical protein
VQSHNEHLFAGRAERRLVCGAGLGKRKALGFLTLQTAKGELSAWRPKTLAKRMFNAPRDEIDPNSRNLDFAHPRVDRDLDAELNLAR